ncbi:CDP-alcohol phosphatidyltransferase [Ahniella affigens]|uniref:CDP-alcohol phosphatidyltransferase n=1 Tax=Ahniella affigens TaxID=2021234 RepID=A0A2P1PQ65_9GAMM|nr:CDP-alcohol phosphatidyltransferase family protein [Ahniella affigens]AVP96987.1 CDP-alcohol phosphatidyltransferase [Ahniella affigens]
MSIYALKPKFQNLLRPLVRLLYRLGVTANQVTVFAALVSVAIGLGLFWVTSPRICFLAIPIWFFLRMALNAIDGILAREFGQQSRLGAYLNELTDVISDSAMYLPFALIAPFSGFWIGTIIVLAAMTEMTGVLGQVIGRTRQYQGPMGKSDRAFVFGALGLAVAIWPTLPAWLGWLQVLLVVSLGWTVCRRIRAGLNDQAQTLT